MDDIYAIDKIQAWGAKLAKYVEAHQENP